MVTALQLSVAVALPVAAGSVDAPQATVISLGSVRTGLVLSTIVITWVDVLKLPTASVAVQVRVILLPEVTSLNVTTGVLQLSVAVATLPHPDGVVAEPQLTGIPGT